VRSIFRGRQGQPRGGPEPPTRRPQEARMPVPQERPVAQAAGAEGYTPRPLETPTPPGRRLQPVASGNNASNAGGRGSRPPASAPSAPRPASTGGGGSSHGGSPPRAPRSGGGGRVPGGPTRPAA